MDNITFYIEQLIEVLNSSSLKSGSDIILLGDIKIKLVYNVDIEQILSINKDHLILKVSLQKGTYICVFNECLIPNILYKIEKR